jgi:glycerol uptake facilitator-like aquaporin
LRLRTFVSDYHEKEEFFMEFVIGIILVLTFFGLAYYCVKGHNLMIGFLIISIVWTALSLLGTLVLQRTPSCSSAVTPALRWFRS